MSMVMPHLLIDALKVAHHLMRHHRVERGDGLVGQYDGGVLIERAGERHALLLAAGELVAAGVGLVEYAHLVQRRERLELLLLCKQPNSTLKKFMSGTMEVSTFFSAVLRVTRLNDWKIMPILRRNRRSERPLSVITSTSSTITWPSVRSIMRLMVRISVDLPAPDRPITATNSPCSICRFTCERPRVPLDRPWRHP